MTRNIERTPREFSPDYSRIRYIAENGDISPETAQSLVRELNRFSYWREDTSLISLRNTYLSRCEEANAHEVIAILNDSRVQTNIVRQ
jgi:hypothetical protein